MTQVVSSIIRSCYSMYCTVKTSKKGMKSAFATILDRVHTLSYFSFRSTNKIKTQRKSFLKLPFAYKKG